MTLTIMVQEVDIVVVVGGVVLVVEIEVVVGGVVAVVD